MSDKKAAFGVYPQINKRRSKQDPEAAKNVPLDLARGALSGVLGAPGDIESLIRLLPGLSNQTVLPTSEDIEKRLPLRSDTPVSRAATGLGQLGGGFYTGPGSPLKAIGALPAAIKHGAGEFYQAAGVPATNVVKNKGGNWLSGELTVGLKDLKRSGSITPENMATVQKEVQLERQAGNEDYARAIEQNLENAKRNNALNDWIDRNLSNYIKKEMATPEDPVRKLAEQGISHIPEANLINRRASPNTWRQRKEAGFPEYGMAENPLAKGWENIADELVYSRKPEQIKSYVKQNNPWIDKLDPNENIYQYNMEGSGNFGHILDVLREDVASGRIRPEQLNKVSMEQAVRRTYEYDQELAAKASAARAAAREGLPVYKEYPEGYRWIELNKPGAFAAESEAMGHSVRGYEPSKGHPDWTPASGDRGSSEYGHGGWEGIKSGKAKVYSLVNPKGEPHVTVEAASVPHPVSTSRRGDNFPEPTGFEYGGKYSPPSPYKPTKEQLEQIHNRAKELWSTLRTGRASDVDKYYQQASDELLGLMPQEITQIKGKGNAAPKEDYLPYVQDFVKSGQWSDVGDLYNTGLYSAKDVNNYMPENFTMSRNLRQQAIERARQANDIPNYMTKAEYEALLQKHAPEDIWTAEKAQRAAEDEDLLRQLQPPEGMKAGGSVHFNDNPDAMQMELNMAGGGLAKLIRAAPKSKEEIEAIAQRLAPQVTGEFVRGEKGTQSVAGKTQKQFAREKEIQHDIRPTVAEQPKPQKLDYEKLKDNVMIGIAGDPTITGKSVHAVAGQPLQSPSPQHGGPMYGHGKDHFWASQLGAARKVQNLSKEVGQQYDAPVMGKYIMMGPESINYAQHFADANLSAINPAKMRKSDIEGFNKLIRQGSPASGPRDSFPGIENPEEAYLYFSVDPELRKHFNALMQMPTVTEKFRLPSGLDVRHAVTEPELSNLETGVTGFSVGKMRPDIPSTELKLSEHPTYSHDIPGEFMGQTQYPIPYELSFPDTLKAIRENPKQAPFEFGSLKMVGPRQIIDQQMIDEIKQYEETMKKLTGKKKGGAVSSGLITVKRKKS